MWNEIENILNNGEKSLSEYKKWSNEYAKKEHDYRVELSKRLLKRRAEGYPVTVLSDIVRGEEDIAKLKQDRDIAEGLKNSAEKGTDFYKLTARLMDAQMTREYNNPRMGFGG